MHVLKLWKIGYEAKTFEFMVAFSWFKEMRVIPTPWTIGNLKPTLTNWLKVGWGKTIFSYYFSVLKVPKINLVGKN